MYSLFCGNLVYTDNVITFIPDISAPPLMVFVALFPFATASTHEDAKTLSCTHEAYVPSGPMLCVPASVST